MYGIARSEASRLERLTGDFLSYARPDQPRRGVLSVMEVVGYISEIARVHAATKGVTVGLEGDQTLQAIADREQIQRALLNLLLNAIDATPHGGHVALRCRASEGGVELEVENSGDPIPQEVLSRIFEPFFTTKPHGTGLGLAISRNVARAHGGDLRVARNEPGHVCFAMTVSDPSASG
jgi:signal transduction histidine kinase